ncbi:tRNA glutamyl-Q(34) synthetase GluQRS [Rhizobium sp. YIM 134829]|uniref:tRNA glutamyl-Q(34) synthetase GluQRS n=1 Tax=Rhizobium sp. YIM 134829 TaxID=3390453 RepID=UPI00397BB6EE
MPDAPSRPVFRFAPSPNGPLHLGHALSALINESRAAEIGGRLLLRIEDIDPARCRPEFETALKADLDWLGFAYERPVRRQSEHLDAYDRAFSTLQSAGLVYPAFLSRGEIKARVAQVESAGASWPRDPDGAPLYPGPERDWNSAQRAAALATGRQHAWRLDMAKAVTAVGIALAWSESGEGPGGQTGEIVAAPEAWGDVILSRPDAPSSYHLSVVVDDALQGVSHVVRGRDLFHATSVHRLLQVLLGLPVPLYHHHRLLLDAHGRKLSKSQGDTGLTAWRLSGRSAAELRRFLLG